MAHETRDGKVSDISSNIEAIVLHEGAETVLDLLITLLWPLDGGFVHLVDDHDHLLNTETNNERERKKIRFDQQQVLTSLTGTIEASLELTLTSGDDLQMARGGMAYHDGGISLSSTSNHVGDIVLVARGIEDGESLLLALQVGTTHFDGFALKSEKKGEKIPCFSLLRWYPWCKPRTRTHGSWTWPLSRTCRWFSCRPDQWCRANYHRW